jgi:hypothetical protein
LPLILILVISPYRSLEKKNFGVLGHIVQHVEANVVSCMIILCTGISQAGYQVFQVSVTYFAGAFAAAEQQRQQVQRLSSFSRSFYHVTCYTNTYDNIVFS